MIADKLKYNVNGWLHVYGLHWYTGEVDEKGPHVLVRELVGPMNSLNKELRLEVEDIEAQIAFRAPVATILKVLNDRYDPDNRNFDEGTGAPGELVIKIPQYLNIKGDKLRRLRAAVRAIMPFEHSLTTINYVP
jgi:hypothetical protein